MERWLTAVWYGQGRGGWVLLPLAWLFGLVSAARRLAYRRGWFASLRVGRPVVVVGNLSVGGTGKTPLVVWLTEALQARGERVGVVTRGYGRHGDGIRVVTPDAASGAVGDEPLLIARRTGAIVVVGADRVLAAREAVRRGATVIVCDDGLQHLRLARDFEIVVIDGARGLGNGRLLPAGPLREGAGRLAHVDAVVENLGADGAAAGRSLPGRGSTAGGQAAPLRLTMRLVPQALQRLGAPSERRPLTSLAGRAVHAVAGIGNPERFFATLRAAGLEVTEHPFPDHHRFAAGDLSHVPAAPVVMTEKDAVKCESLPGADLWYLPVSAGLEGGEALLERLGARLAASAAEA